MRLIDADALREEVLYDNTFENDIVNYYLGVIDDQPTVDAEPVRRGEWIDEGNGLYSCSECLILDHREPKHNFCPNCGAKMDKEG